MTYEEALKWCQEYLATVQFYSVYLEPRVLVRAAGGVPICERDTFLEAVEACVKWQADVAPEYSDKPDAEDSVYTHCPRAIQRCAIARAAAIAKGHHLATSCGQDRWDSIKELFRTLGEAGIGEVEAMKLAGYDVDEDE